MNNSIVPRKIPAEKLEQAAREYAAAGFYMIPLRPGQKLPLIKTGRDHLEAATIDPKQVEQWIRRWPDMDLGIVTGAGSGIVVVDIDGPKGAAALAKLEQKHGPLPETPTVLTSRGRHLYLRHPGGRIKTTSSVVAPGIDIRGDGGLVAAPPSIHKSGFVYQWDCLFDLSIPFAPMPGWLVELTREKPLPQTVNRTAPGGETIPEGSRNSMLTSLAGSLRRTGLGGEDLVAALMAINIERCDPPLEESEVRTIAGSIGAKPAGPLPAASAAYFDRDGNFLPNAVVKELQGEYHPVVQHQIPYVYHDGVYREVSPDFFKHAVHEKLGDRYRHNRGVEVLQQVLTASWRPTGFFREDQNEINLPNGILNWHTGQLRPHSPEYYSRTQLPPEHDPEADCPLCMKFLADVLEPDAIGTVQEILGYLLIPDTTMQKAILCISPGESGKSVFLELIEALLGRENVSHEALQALCDNRFRAANLYGKLANVFADLPASFIEEAAIFKILATGEPLSAERKGKDPFTFRNTARMIFSANALPKANDNSHGYFRRWLILRFPNQFPPGHPARDERLIEKLTTPGELSGLLNWAIEGLRRLKDRGYFDEPASSRSELEEYRRTNDSVRAFAEEYLAEDPTGRVERANVFPHYRIFCGEENLRPVAAQRFYAKLREIFPMAGEAKSGGSRMITGVRYVPHG